MANPYCVADLEGWTDSEDFDPFDPIKSLEHAKKSIQESTDENNPRGFYAPCFQSGWYKKYYDNDEIIQLGLKQSFDNFKYLTPKLKQNHKYILQVLKDEKHTYFSFVELVREMPDNIKEFVRERKWYEAQEQIDKFLLCEKLNSTLNNMRKNESGVLCKAQI